MGWTYHEWYSYYGRYKDTPISESPHFVRNYSVVHIGHLTSTFEQKTQTQHCAKLTLMREPVDRVVSAFYYHKHNESDWTDCFDSQCRLWWEYTNDVTRRFTNNLPTWNSYVTDKYLANDPLTDTSLRQAQETLEQFGFVCFIDTMRDCILQLGRYYGIELDLPKDLIHNANKLRQEVSADLQQRLAAHNWMDVALYKWAQAKFGSSSSGEKHS